MILDSLIFHQSNNTAKKKREDEDMYCKVGAVKAKSLLSLSPEKLIWMCVIGLNTAVRTLDAKTHQCIRSTGLLTKLFKSDKAQLRYK